MPACRQAQGQECLPPGKKECLPVRGSIGYKQVELLFTCGQMPSRRPLNAFLPLLSNSFLFALWLFTVPMPVCLRAGRHKGRQTSRQVNRQAGKSACHPARKNACRFVGLLVTNSRILFTCGQCRFVDFLTHFCHYFPIVSFFVLWHFTLPMSVCLRAGRHKGRQVNRQAGKNACHPARKNACRFANLKAYGQAAMLIFTCVAAFGTVVAACGVFEPYFRLGKHPTFAPKRQGKAESAYSRPRPVLLSGSKKVSGDRCLAGPVTAGIISIRRVRIFVSSKTQQGVL